MTDQDKLLPEMLDYEMPDYYDRCPDCGHDTLHPYNYSCSECKTGEDYE